MQQASLILYVVSNMHFTVSETRLKNSVVINKEKGELIRMNYSPYCAIGRGPRMRHSFY